MLGLVPPDDHGEERRLLLPAARHRDSAEWTKRWQATTTNLRPTTRDLYAYLLRRFLLPTFGKAALSSINPLAVRAWLTNLQAEKLSPSTVAKAYRLLSRILGAAVEAGYLPRNSCTVKGASQERAPEMRFATVAQVAALADAIDPCHRALILVAAYGGLRWGELVGLRVKRVDLLHGRVTAAEQVAEVNGQLIPGPPKTEAGHRTVTLPAVAAVALAEHLANFAEPGPEGLVFPARQGGYLRRSTSAAAGGCPPRGRLELRGYEFMICATRPPPWRWRLGEHPRVDGAHGPHLAAGRAALPACDGRPGSGHRRCPGRAGPGRRAGGGR